MDICPKCGLPLQACVCKEISREQQHIELKTEKRRFGKKITLVLGFTGNDASEMAKALKSELACGGTMKNNVIELQGDHKGKIKPILVKMGFDASQIKE